MEENAHLQQTLSNLGGKNHSFYYVSLILVSKLDKILQEMKIEDAYLPSN